jgi:hypothetical protein
MGVAEDRLSDLTTLLRTDLAAFADPGAELIFQPAEDDWVRASWQQDGRRHSADFQLAGATNLADVTVRSDQESAEYEYGTFLAGDAMADLKALARNMLSVVEPVAAYVPPRAVPQLPADAESDGEAVAVTLLTSLAEASRDETAVVFVTAEAGVGKTSLLTHLVHEKAEGFLRGEEASLWLYVNAQGSRLARLDQALAATLDDLRARFPYHATTALVRSGVVVLVIDGFDELIGTQGTYDEAFSSLATFIEGLRGAGSLVAAARSAYYEQEFAARADTTIGFRTDRWSLRPMSLLDWNKVEREAFLRLFSEQRTLDSENTEGLIEQVEELFDDPALTDLAGKPLFVSRVAALLADGVELEPGGELVGRLISTYVRREVNEKLLSPRGVPLLSAEQLTAFYSELAEELWRQETRELSRTSLRELVQILVDLYELDEDARATVVERTPYSAVMRTGSTPGSVAFEHELYFSYFLAQPIIEALDSRDPAVIARALRKGRLPAQTGFLAGRGVDLHTEELLNLLSRAPATVSVGGERVRENAGLVAAGSLRRQPVTGLSIEGLDFVDCDLSGVEASESQLRGCSLRGVDLRGSRFVSCRAEDVFLDGVIVNGETVLEIEALPLESISGLIVENGRRAAIYAPDELQEALAPTGLPAAQTRPQARRPIDSDAVALVQLLARIYEHTNLATADDENAMRRVVQDEYWPAVHSALIETGIMREEKRSASGNKVFMRMLVRPRDLLTGIVRGSNVDTTIHEFWDQLEERAPLSP